MIYRIGQKGLESMEVSECDKKNNLLVGTVLRLNGYTNPKYVIVKNLGFPEGCPGYGARYITVKLEDNTLSRQDAYTMKYIADKKDNRIQMYITDEVMHTDEVLAIWEKAKQKEADQIVKQKEAAEIAETQTLKGRLMFERLIPEKAQALIVAEFEFDMCDLQTDYFATHTTRTVILGWSKHKRDLFSEMRKYAGLIPETKHLKEPPKFDSIHKPKTEQNKSWWHPCDEHREKHSMGHGYYLKATGRYSTGWLVRKVVKYNDGWSEYLFRSLADQCILEEPKTGR